MTKKKAMSSENTDESVDKSVKRAFLEVTELDKYKSVFINNKPFETKRLKTSDVLDKVKQFLPSLKESTDKLLVEYKENPSNVDIENCENDENIIEMNLQFVEENSDSSSSDSSDDNDETDEEIQNSEDEKKEKKVLDINELINQDQVKVNSDILFKSKNKAKKPFIKIIDNNEDSSCSSEDKPCTSKDSQ